MFTNVGRATKVTIKLRRATAKFKDARLAIITHGKFIDLTLKAFLGQNPRQQYFFSHFYQQQS